MRPQRRKIAERQRQHVQCRFGWLYFILASVLCILAAIPALILYDAAMVELHLTNHSNETTKRILLMGWVSSLKDLSDNWTFLKEAEELCSTYDPTKPRGYGYHEGHEGGMHVHIFYRQENEAARHEIQAVLSQQGCSVELTHEESLIERHGVAKARSIEREMVMQDNIHYNAVVNIDLDGLISLPSLSSFHNALTRAIADPGAVLCANEKATWHLLFYQLLGFGRSQGNHPSEATPRQIPYGATVHSGDYRYCSDGFSMYSWKPWSSPHCSFDNDDKNERDTAGQSLRQSQNSNDRGLHVMFQQCLVALGGDTWIVVQPDLVVWRKTWWSPWLKLLSLVLMVALLWDPVTTLASTWRRSGVSTRLCTNRANKLR